MNGTGIQRPADGAVASVDKQDHADIDVAARATGSAEQNLQSSSERFLDPFDLASVAAVIESNDARD
jgi:hypothetical protein